MGREMRRRKKRVTDEETKTRTTPSHMVSQGLLVLESIAIY